MKIVMNEGGRDMVAENLKMSGKVDLKAQRWSSHFFIFLDYQHLDRCMMMKESSEQQS